MVRSGLFDRGGNAVPLLGVDVRAEVVAGHACAVVKQRYRNDEKKPIEAVYTFPLPSKAALTGFVMIAGGRRVEGEIHEREEAFRRYDDAITAGHGGALVEQERPNVFTATVGNLLPGEETIVEIHYVEPLLADEGAVRWSIPTLVAPRYIPGNPTGDRTAHGVADPTDRVPDADRISPPIGDVQYGLTLDLTFDLGTTLDVESPSHAIATTRDGDKVHVTFSQKDVALDRDVVVTAYAQRATTNGAPIASAIAHRRSSGGGVVALSLVPDLGAGESARKHRPRDVVFVLDRSGSMGGASMTEARTALRLCLRQLREGDRFGIVAFDDVIEKLAIEMVPFTQATLQRADAWLESIDARGGTELLAPMALAAQLAPDGVIVLLTDGEVGNEDEILAAFRASRRSARVYSFGIGTNVSDSLLHALAEETGGAVEKIHPGERVDEKVIAQVARATARRVTDVSVMARGIELGELAPAEPRALVDGEPFSLFATWDEPGRGAIELRGKLDGETFFLEVPVDLDAATERPVLAQLWAQARIRELERADVTGRRAETMKQRIVSLAKEHGVASRYTSFVVVEKRTGDRRSHEQPETRVIPVNAPAGWAMFAPKKPPMLMSAAMPARAMAPMAMAPSPARAVPPPSAAGMRPSAMRGGMSTGAPPPAPAPMPAHADMDEGAAELSFDEAEQPKRKQVQAKAKKSGDPALAVLEGQGASGLWEESGRDPVELTVDALLVLLRLGLTSAHAVYGAQIKKAVDALLAAVAAAPSIEARLRELALAVAWLLSSGRRTRHGIEDAVRGGGAALATLSASLQSESSVRARIDHLSPPA